SRRRHTRFSRDWSSDVCSSDLLSEFTYYAVKSSIEIAVTVSNGLSGQEDNKQSKELIDLILKETEAEIDNYLTMMIYLSYDELRSEERRVGRERRSRGARSLGS